MGVIFIGSRTSLFQDGFDADCVSGDFFVFLDDEVALDVAGVRDVGAAAEFSGIDLGARIQFCDFVGYVVGGGGGDLLWVAGLVLLAADGVDFDGVAIFFTEQADGTGLLSLGQG